jgi:hypothetical protein
VKRTLAALLAAAALAACDPRSDAPPPPPDAFPGAPEPSAHPDPATGPFAKVQYVTLAASEPATIYYTTDGSGPVPGAPSTRSGRNPVFWIRAGPGTTTLTWFAVDDAGNRGPTAVATYAVTIP